MSSLSSRMKSISSQNACENLSSLIAIGKRPTSWSLVPKIQPQRGTIRSSISISTSVRHSIKRRSWRCLPLSPQAKDWKSTKILLIEWWICADDSLLSRFLIKAIPGPPSVKTQFARRICRRSRPSSSISKNWTSLKSTPKSKEISTPLEETHFKVGILREPLKSTLPKRPRKIWERSWWVSARRSGKAAAWNGQAVILR